MLLGIQLGGFYFRLQDFHLLWCIFQMLCLISALPSRCPTTPSALANGLGCFLFARRYWGNRFCFLFLQLLRCFSSLGWLVPTYEFSRSYWGFSHSEIFGSLLVSSSPKRFVGNYVLLRLCVPRYPPLALSSLTCYFWTTLAVCLHTLTWFRFSLILLTFLFIYAVFKVLTGVESPAFSLFLC